MSRFGASLLAGELEPSVRARREQALTAVEAALEAVDARESTARGLAALRAEGLDLERCVVFAFGKAARGMVEAAVSTCRPRAGLALGLEEASLGPVRMHRGGHPVPAPDAAVRGAEFLALAESLGPGDTALCLVSGGGSSMLELPREGFDLDSVRRRTRELMDQGADIVRLNRERTSMSRLKGGGLARAIAPARIVNLVISDVPGHGPELVASGPTLLPDAITRVVADNRAACEAAARVLGVQCSPELLRGPAREAGRRMVEGPCTVPRVRGGETTVSVLGPGRGGRCQELVLGAASGLRSGLLLAVGTDGVDGRSDAAGALLDDAVLLRASQLGLDASEFLARSDSARFFERAGGALSSGPTGTNVADLCLYLP